MLCVLQAQGQSISTNDEKSPASPYVGKLTFSGNKSISNEELRQVIATSEHTSFLGLGIFGGAYKPFVQEEFEKDLLL
ncbi:MAG: outer membrane protein assembly factor, partial [Chlorobiales bacterium]|nr:outer membrane protein assembly factor [Chlorobiales bacterium]